MKKIFLSLALLSFTFMACNNEAEEAINDSANQQDILTEDTRATLFPKEDESIELMWLHPCQRAKVLLEAAGSDCGKKLGDHIEITDAQYKEIADFIKDHVKNCKTEYEKYEMVFQWLGDNITYGASDNKPYTMFTKKVGVCQGYADLLTVMLHALEIPCITVNGTLRGYGGHAWNYLNADGKWYVSDPTNGGKYDIKDYDSYQNLLYVQAIQATLFEDEYCTYNYYNMQLNVESFKSGNSAVTVPYSINDYRITSVNPTKEGSTDIKELYLGKNVESLDLDGNTFGIALKYNSIETIEVDPENTNMSSYHNVVYKGDDMYLVAPGAKFVQVKPVKLDKESKLKYLNNLETIVFEPGISSISSYVVENCPNLKTAYVPEGVKIDDKAFSKVHPSFEIIRGDYTNIENIWAD